LAPQLRGLVRELDFREHISKSWLFVSFVLRQKKGKPMRTLTRPLTQNLALNVMVQTIYRLLLGVALRIIIENIIL
jgi:hypothetical protein